MKAEELSGVRVWLVTGEEFQRTERFREVIDAAVDPATKDFNCDIFTPESFKVDVFSEVVMTFPMMAERRVVALRDFDKIHTETRKKVAAAVKDTPDTTLVVIEGEKGTLTPKPPKAVFRSESFKQIYENRLPAWLNTRFARRGMKIRPGAVALLINNVGTSLRDLDNEIEKVTIAAVDTDTVTEEHVARVVGEFRRDTIWNFTNAVAGGDFNSAAGILRSLMETEKNKESYYLSAIAGHIMKLAAYNSLRKRGVQHDEAMKTVTTSPFLWKLNKYDSQAKRMTEREVRKALTLLTRADSNLKKYSIDKQLMMELLVPLLAGSRRPLRT